jgi:branched-chain amino acid transport system ATP-binding protein
VPPANIEKVLWAENVGKRFGVLPALSDVSFFALSHQVTGLIGPNGSGKSTLINIMSGHESLDRGRVHFLGSDVTQKSPRQFAKMGLARTYQKARLFSGLTVLENVMVGFYAHQPSGFTHAVFRPLSERRREVHFQRDALSVLESMGLSQWSNRSASSLPYGVQRLVEIARALALRPRMLLLDEPAAGLEEEEKATLGRLLNDLKESGMSIVLVEHDLLMVMSVCDAVTVLNAGHVIAHGTPREVQGMPEVVEAYLGDSLLVEETSEGRIDP